ncbi:hypothetical protein JXQ31_17330 [candidate division KSB1 bacterium]|nr:hypothetical protein [candidate division KSB1 bacterium]
MPNIFNQLHYVKLIRGILFLIIIINVKIYAQFMSINPPVLSLEINDNQNFQDFPTSVEIAVNTNAEDWVINCMGQPFVSEKPTDIIPIENILVKHEYITTSNDKKEYRPLALTEFIASGKQTNNEYKIVNSLLFRLNIPNYINFGNYICELRFHYSDNLGRTEEVILQLNTNYRKYLKIAPNFHLLKFEIFGSPGIYDYKKDAKIILHSNDEFWTLKFELLPIVSEQGEIFDSKNFLLLLQPATNRKIFQQNIPDDYWHFNQPLTIPLQMNKMGKNFSVEFNCNFRIQTNWEQRTGDYHGALKIYVVEQPGIQISIPIEIIIHKSNTMQISANDLYFHVKGEGAIWDGDKDIRLIVGSNCESWIVNCRATVLESQKGYIIPNERIYIKNDQENYNGDEGAGIGFHSLIQPVDLVKGTLTEPREICKMLFRLKSKDLDRPGRYTGKIILTHLTVP